MNSKVILAVGIGGIIGAISRYLIGELLLQSNHFPLATIVVNLFGCFLLSFILFQPWIKQAVQPWLFTGITTGIIGSFTTFSTITIELFDLWQKNIGLMLGYFILTIFGGLLCCYLGYRLARRGDNY